MDDDRPCDYLIRPKRKDTKTQVHRLSANAIKVWVNAIKKPDHHKYKLEWISASYKMFRRGIGILILSLIIKFFYKSLRIFKVKFVTFQALY